MLRSRPLPPFLQQALPPNAKELPELLSSIFVVLLLLLFFFFFFLSFFVVVVVVVAISWAAPAAYGGSQARG